MAHGNGVFYDKRLTSQSLWLAYNGSSDGNALQIATGGYVATNAVATLDATHALFGWSDVTTYYASVKLLTQANKTLTGGTTLVLDNTVACKDVRVYKIDDTSTFFCIWRRLSSPEKVAACVVSVAGDYSLSKGTTIVCNDGNDATNGTACVINGSLAVIAYQDVANSNYGAARTVSISGTTLTENAELTYNSARTDVGKMYMLSPTKVFINFDKDTSNFNTSAAVLSISGTTLSVGSLNKWYGDSTTLRAMACNSAFNKSGTFGITAYHSNFTTQPGTLVTVPFSISGTTVSTGPTTNISTNCSNNGGRAHT